MVHVGLLRHCGVRRDQGVHRLRAFPRVTVADALELHLHGVQIGHGVLQAVLLESDVSSDVEAFLAEDFELVLIADATARRNYLVRQDRFAGRRRRLGYSFTWSPALGQ